MVFRRRRGAAQSDEVAPVFLEPGLPWVRRRLRYWLSAARSRGAELKLAVPVAVACCAAYAFCFAYFWVVYTFACSFFIVAFLARIGDDWSWLAGPSLCAWVVRVARKLLGGR